MWDICPRREDGERERETPETLLKVFRLVDRVAAGRHSASSTYISYTYSTYIGLISHFSVIRGKEREIRFQQKKRTKLERGERAKNGAENVSL